MGKTIPLAIVGKLHGGGIALTDAKLLGIYCKNIVRPHRNKNGFKGRATSGIAGIFSFDIYFVKAILGYVCVEMRDDRAIWARSCLNVNLFRRTVPEIHVVDCSNGRLEIFCLDLKIKRSTPPAAA
jgi:hypothetical protein